MEEKVRTRIPESIRDITALCEPGIYIGGKDLWDLPWDAPDDKAVYYGRSQFAVGLTGHSTPPQTRKYEELIVQVHEIVQFQRDLESILGPLKRCIIWSV